MGTERMTQGTTEGAGEGVCEYEAPRLIPMGNLRDLLAGDGGTSCDAGSGNLTNGHDDPGAC